MSDQRADLELNIEAKFDQAMSGIMAINERLDETERKARNANAAHKEHNESMQIGANQAIQSLGAMAVSFGAVGTAIAGAKAIWDEWNKRIEETSQRQVDFNTSLMNLVEGNVQAFDAMLPRVKSISQQYGLTTTEAIAALTKIDDTVGKTGKVSLDEQMAMFEQAARAKRLGMDVGEVAGTMGGIKAGMAPNATPEQTLGMAYGMMTRDVDTGQLGDAKSVAGVMNKMRQAGFGEEESVTMMTRALASGQKPSFLGGVMDFAHQLPELPAMTPGRAMAPKDAEKRRKLMELQGLSEIDRVNRLLNDPDLAGYFGLDSAAISAMRERGSGVAEDIRGGLGAFSEQEQAARGSRQLAASFDLGRAKAEETWIGVGSGAEYIKATRYQAERTTRETEIKRQQYSGEINDATAMASRKILSSMTAGSALEDTLTSGYQFSGGGMALIGEGDMVAASMEEAAQLAQQQAKVLQTGAAASRSKNSPGRALAPGSGVE